MKPREPEPPAFGTWILKKIYREDMFDDVAGDLQEMFVDRLRTRGRWLAVLYFYRDVLLSIRNLDLKRKNRAVRGSRLILLSNNLKTTVRTFRRNWIYSGLNIFGLALGMAAFMFILRYVDYEKNFDRFHPDHKELYRIRYEAWDSHGTLVKNLAVTAPRVAPYLKEKLPEVKAVARAQAFGALVYSYGITKYREDGTLIVDPEFLTLFNFPLVEGDAATCLQKVNSLVISERTAKKYFGDEPAVGKVMDIDGYKDYVVTGIFRDVPGNSHLRFDFLLSYATLRFWRGEDVETSWTWYDFYSYVLLEPGTDPEELQLKFNHLFDSDERGKANHERGVQERFLLQPVTDIHLYSHLSGELATAKQGDGDAIVIFMIIAFFILVIAWINYINLSTARALERAKEVGIRKAIGAHQRQLISQFLVEAFLMNFLALFVALLIVVTGMHYFNSVTGLQLDVSFLYDRKFWGEVVLVLTFGSLLSGLYPAFVLSSFQPQFVLKGKFTTGRSGIGLRRALVIFQFTASVSLIAGTLIVYKQLNYLLTRDLGFDMTRTMIIRGPNPVNDQEDTPAFAIHSTTFKDELMKFSGIVSVTSSSTVPGNELRQWRAVKKAGSPDDQFKLIFTEEVDAKFLSSYRIEVIAGGNHGDTASLVLNETAVKTLGFESPEAAIQAKVIFGNELRTVVGVVKDYHQLSAKHTVQPLALELRAGAYYFYAVKLAEKDYRATISRAQNLYQAFYPIAAFEYFFLEDYYNAQYGSENKFGSLVGVFAGFAIFVACLGLFGLSSFSAIRRTKEIGIRKVLGADIMNIVYLLSREFVGLVVLGNVIAWPVIYFFMNDWLDHFATRISIGFPILFLSGSFVVGVSLLTVGYRTLVTARSNPVDSLKYE